MKTWQEHIGAMPHMIYSAAVSQGFEARDPQYVNAEGIAIIDISGVLVNQAWDGWSTSGYGRIATDVQAALDDSAIDGILLRVNSPGGEVTNAFETADAIVAAGKQKTVWASVDPMAYSAGYLLASSASRIFVAPKSGGVGSIGVYTVHLDMSEMLKMMGVKATFIEVPKGKSDGHPYKPLSADAKAEMGETIKYLSGMFFQHVADRRGMNADDIRNMQARTFDGGRASIDVGLADRIGSLGNALAQMRGYLDARKETSYFSVAGSAARSAQEVPQMAETEHAAEAVEQTAEQVQTETATAVTEQAQAAPPATQADASEAEEITALCAIAGQPAAVALGFITEKKSSKEVRAALLAMRAAKDSETETISMVAATTATQPVPASESPLVKAAEKAAAEHAAKGGK
ncbi:MAG: S49 family peptidase [Acidobacteriales bacterium]|nr:S49 family peptidase [Terriglobales bacterium]